MTDIKKSLDELPDEGVINLFRLCRLRLGTGVEGPYFVGELDAAHINVLIYLIDGLDGATLLATPASDGKAGDYELFLQG